MSDSDYTSAPNWSDEQWGRVCKVVADEAQKSRVAAQLLPLYGPLDPQVVAVPNLRLGFAPGAAGPGARASNRLIVDSTPDDFLTTISVQVPLPSYQVADPELGAALVAFRRAAVTIARIEDAIVFNGQPARGVPPTPTFAGGWLAGLPMVYSVTGGAAQPGLVPAGIIAPARVVARAPLGANVVPRESVPVPTPAVGSALLRMQVYATDLVLGVSRAISYLEGNGQSGPFACFLSPHAYDGAHTPDAAMVLARDRILPFLGGDYLRRTNTIPNGYGIVVALCGGPVEIVVARDITVRYQQQTAEPRFLFRVSEKIALRVKEWNAIAVLYPEEKTTMSGESSVPASQERIMSQTVKPVAPSVEDVEVQIRETIRQVKNDQAKIKKAMEDHAAALDNRIKKLTADLGKEKDPEKQKKLLEAHQEFVEEHKRRGSELGRQDIGLERQLEQLTSDLKDMDDLGD